MKKIIFLDIDGVLATDAYTNSIPNDKPFRDSYGDLFDPKCVAALKRIIDETGADIVISSDWRHNGLLAMQEMWTHRGLPGKVIDVTPYITEKHDYGEGYTRANEIIWWRTINNEDGPYVVIDDMRMGLYKFVHTAHNVGLTQADADKAISCLNS